MENKKLYMGKKEKDQLNACIHDFAPLLQEAAAGRYGDAVCNLWGKIPATIVPCFTEGGWDLRAHHVRHVFS